MKTFFTSHAGKSNPDRTSVIFPDTEFPKNWNKIRSQSASVMWAPRRPLEPHRALAELTLKGAGFAHDSESLDRISNDCNLAPEIREAFRLLTLHEYLAESNRQFSQEIALAGSHKLPDSCIDFIRFLFEDSQEVAGEIAALGKSIIARQSERLARIGKTKVKGAKPLARSTGKTIPLWDRVLLALLKLYPNWSNRHIAREALKNPPANLKPGTRGHGSLGSLRRRVALLRSRISTSANPSKK
jgi:hypothetical protein